ncbi:hypothetical protein NIIDMKKI_22650 [Mycobacterium kansasii]|uniref:Uncharacterized protein n=1 Tax=Mycobacterium kansasii TaxID=1768 RepID=A0A7G1IBY2_MYCKA|nr:hypothetical protein NIIDMKKI_22650 [Mycobacterium kansasii]
MVATNAPNNTRFAATAAGCTVAATADSNAVAAATAEAAAVSACTAAALNHPTYGAAAAAIDTDAGPAHGPPVNPAITASNDDADPANSAARPAHADAAANNGPAPAPAKIRAELISGGNHANSGTIPTPNQPAVTNGTDNQPNPNTHQPIGGS